MFVLLYKRLCVGLRAIYGHSCAIGAGEASSAASGDGFRSGERIGDQTDLLGCLLEFPFGIVVITSERSSSHIRDSEKYGYDSDQFENSHSRDDSCSEEIFHMVFLDMCYYAILVLVYMVHDAMMKCHLDDYHIKKPSI